MKTRASIGVVIGCGMLLLIGCAPSSPAPDLTGDVVAGQAIYDANCAACHRLGSYDGDGSRDLSGRESAVTAGWVEGHRGLSLSDQQISDLQTFIASH